MKAQKQQWSDDEGRIEIIKAQIKCASDDQVEVCLKKLQAHEQLLQAQRRGKKKRYVRFPEVLNMFKELLVIKGIKIEEDQILDVFDLLTDEYGGATTSIPKDLNNLS